MKKGSYLLSKRITTFLLVLVMLFSSIFVSPQAVDAASAKTSPKSITLSGKRATLYAGESMTLSVKKVTGLKGKGVTYKSSKSGVVSVSNKGVITARKKGSATITVTSRENKKVKATFWVTVNAKPKKSSIVLQKKSTSLFIGKSETIKVKKVTGLSSKNVTYKSSNSKVASVSSKGVVKAKNKGTTTITVTSSVNKKTKTVFRVTVKAKTVKKSITLSKKSMTLSVGEKENVKISHLEGISKKDVTYKSSNKTIAMVTGDGVITGKKKGTAIITVSSKTTPGVSAKLSVTVKERVVKKSITLAKKEATILIGETITIPIKSLSGVKKSDIAYKTNSPEVVSVSSKGEVTGKKKGAVHIKVYDRRNEGTVSVDFLVIVKQPVEVAQWKNLRYGYFEDEKEYAELSGEWYILYNCVNVFDFDDADRSVSVTSSNENVIKITKDIFYDYDLIVPVGKGASTITVKTNDGKRSFSWTVTVSDRPTSRYDGPCGDGDNYWCGGCYTKFTEDAIYCPSCGKYQEQWFQY